MPRSGGAGLSLLRSFKQVGWPANLFASLAILALAASISLGVLGLTNPEFFSGAAAFATVAAVFFGVTTFSRNRQRQRSEFCYEQAKLAVELAHQVLANGTNDRITWIKSARLLMRSEHLVQHITEDDHLDAFEILREDYRVQFSGILGLHDHNRSSEFWENSESGPISTKSIYAIWRFASYPSDYEDPLKGDFSQSEIDRLLATPHLQEYLEKNQTHMWARSSHGGTRWHPRGG